MVRLSGSRGAALAAVLAIGAGCGARNLVDDAGGGPGGTFGGGAPGPAIDADLSNLEVLGDFSLETVARLNLTGEPPRNGIWYSYNDASATCLQLPAPAGFYAYRASMPATPSPGPSGGLALHAAWKGCNIWGAGIGVDFRLIEPGDGAAPVKEQYDLTGVKGITFWAMATPGYDPYLRFKVVMRSETLRQEGGGCDENVVGINKCRDSWGQTFTLPIDGTWQQVVVVFDQPHAFKQEGWGAIFVWDPRDVFGIEIQSRGTEIGEPFDFWIDDLYLIK